MLYGILVCVEACQTRRSAHLGGQRTGRQKALQIRTGHLPHSEEPGAVFGRAARHDDLVAVNDEGLLMFPDFGLVRGRDPWRLLLLELPVLRLRRSLVVLGPQEVSLQRRHFTCSGAVLIVTRLGAFPLPERRKRAHRLWVSGNVLIGQILRTIRSRSYIAL